MTNPNSPDAAELTETIRSLRRQIRTRYLLSFVCWIGAVCAVTALVGSRDPDADRNTYAGIFAAVSLIGSLIFFVILAISYHRLEMRINGMQDRCMKSALREDVHKHNSRCIAAAGIMMIASAVFFLLSLMFNSSAHSKVRTLNTAAKFTYLAATSYQNDLDERDQNYRLQTIIVNLDSPDRNNEPHQKMRDYFRDAFDNYNYAIICDENGIVTGALCSRRPITEYDLTHLQSFDEMLKKNDRMFRKEDAVAYYGVLQTPDDRLENEEQKHDESEQP